MVHFTSINIILVFYTTLENLDKDLMKNRLDLQNRRNDGDLCDIRAFELCEDL